MSGLPSQSQPSQSESRRDFFDAQNDLRDYGKAIDRLDGLDIGMELDQGEDEEDAETDYGDVVNHLLAEWTNLSPASLDTRLPNPSLFDIDGRHGFGERDVELPDLEDERAHARLYDSGMY
jgi:hypothetical protein